MNKPVFGFDIDDVVFDTFSVIKHVFMTEHGIDVGTPTRFGLEEECNGKMATSQVSDAIDKALSYIDMNKPIHGALEFLREYQLVTKNKIIFITSRRLDMKNPTEELLSKWIPNLDYVVFYAKDKSKGDFAVENGIQFFIDDRVKYCVDVASRGIVALMPRRSWNILYQDPLCTNKVVRVRDYDDINLIFNTFLHYQM